jgi:hypothetical protein
MPLREAFTDSLSTFFDTGALTRGAILGVSFFVMALISSW